MSSDNFFENPFPPYSPQLARHYFDENGELNRGCKIVAKLEEKWNHTLLQFKYLDFNDFSVYTGTSGVALLRLKRDDTNKQNLQELRELLSLHRLKKKRCTFLCGDAGPLAIAAVVDFRLGSPTYFNHVQALKIIGEQILDVNSDVPNEHLYGRAGYLYSILYVNKQVDPPPFDDTLIRKMIETIFLCGKNLAKAGRFRCPLMYEWHDSYYLGAAHGVSGILYLLLQIKDYLTEAELNSLIRPTIDYLSSLRFPSGNFPSSLGRETDNKVQWCHGAPGFVFLYSAAYKVFGDSKYLQLALESGEVVWERGLLRKGYSMCHGVSGNAYCFLELYQTTMDEIHLYRAVRFAEWCMDYTRNHEEHFPDRPLSLFEGIAGPMYLLLDIQNPLEAKFPGFTL